MEDWQPLLWWLDEYSLKLGPFSIQDSSSVLANAPRPKRPLIVYKYNASLYCKGVQETINLLDLTVEYWPCSGARQGKFLDQLYSKTYQRAVPYLINPNRGTKRFESGDQIEYLLMPYGPPEEEFDQKVLWPITFAGFSIYTSTLVVVLWNFPGWQGQANARPDNEDMQPLELWEYKLSPFVHPVREQLGSLCLPHVMVSCPQDLANMDGMVEKMGRFQVPFLVNPNMGIEMFEGPIIVEYLEAIYTASSEVYTGENMHANYSRLRMARASVATRRKGFTDK
jgi:hypothetical protein